MGNAGPAFLGQSGAEAGAAPGPKASCRAFGNHAEELLGRCEKGVYGVGHLNPFLVASSPTLSALGAGEFGRADGILVKAQRPALSPPPPRRFLRGLATNRGHPRPALSLHKRPDPRFRVPPDCGPWAEGQGGCKRPQGPGTGQGGRVFRITGRK